MNFLALLAVAHVMVDHLDNRYRELRVPLPEGTREVVIERGKQLPTFLDLVALEVSGRRVALPGLPENLHLRDLTVAELREPLTVRLPAPAQKDSVLVVAGRQEKDAPAGVPFHLQPAGAYRIGSQRGRMRIDGHLDDGLAAPFLRIPTSPGTGHPTGWATAWVRDDGKDLYAALDFGSDDTDDDGADYAELWVAGKPWRVTAARREFGAVSMERTDSARYLHKVYEFKVPLPKKRGLLQLAFAAYGTAAPAAKIHTCIAPDGLTIGYHNRPANNAAAQVYVYGYDAGWNPLATYDPGAAIYDAYPDALCLTWLTNGPAGDLILHAADDGGVETVADLTAQLGPVTQAAVAVDGGRFVMVRGVGDSGVYDVEPDGGVAQQVSVSDNDVNPLITAEGGLAMVTDFNSATLEEISLDGGAWYGPDASTANATPLTATSYRPSDLAPSGGWFAMCPSGDTLHLYQRDAGAWTQDFSAPDVGCNVVAVGEGGEVAHAQGTVVFTAVPPSYNDADAGSSAAAVTALHLSADAGSIILETTAGVALLSFRDLTIVRGLLLPAQGAAMAAPGNPLLSIALRGEPLDTVVLDALTVHVSGTMAADKVHLYEDVDQRGTVTASDVELGTAAAPDSSGDVAFTGLSVNVTGSADVFLLATVEVAASATGTVTASVTPAAAAAHLASFDYHFVPAGDPFGGVSLTVASNPPPPPPDLDAGTDAGTDAGADAGSDAGTTPPAKKASGCGCSTAGLDAWLIVSAIGAGFAARRRRR